MSWKNLALRWKFLVGFGVILVLLTGVGGQSILGIDGIVGNAEQVIEGNKLKGTFLQRVIDHLDWANEVNAFLNDDTIKTLDVQTNPRECGFGKWYYSDARKQAETLVPAIKPLLAEIETPHARLHESAVEISNKFVQVDREMGSFLREKKVDHLQWMKIVNGGLLDESTYNIDVQTNPRQCGFGKWLYSEDVEQLKREYPKFATELDAVYKPHAALHTSVQEINRLLADGDRREAIAVFNEQTSAFADQTFAAIDKIIAWHDEKLTRQSEARKVYTEKTLPSLLKTQGLLDQIRDTVNANIMTDQAMLSQASATRINVSLLVAAAIPLGILLAYIIAKGILGPLRKGMSLAEVIAEGDLTQDIDVHQKDEVGQLADSLRKMSEGIRGVVGQVLHGAENVAAGSEELSASAQQMSQGATEQAASIEEVSSSMDEMAGNIEKNADNARETESISSKVAVDAEKSGKAVSQTVEAMQEIAEKISIIEEIARQTNLLALNAAIEAARAGEHGKGFAVVAAEVRKLAERSGEAAAEISELSSSSMDVARNAGDMLGQLVPDIKKTAELVQEITSASNEMSTGATEINTSIQQLDIVIQKNAAMSEEVSSTSEELSAQSQLLQATMSYFTVNGGGADTSRTQVSVQPTKQKPPALAPGDDEFETF